MKTAYTAYQQILCIFAQNLLIKKQPLKKCRKSGPFHGLSSEGLRDDLLTAIGLILQGIAILALTCGGRSGVAVYHYFSP